jgi:hypothetical protein
MVDKYLITLGCSWTYGDGDETDNQGWTGLLAENVGRTLDNLANNGNSNLNQFLQLLNYKTEVDDVLVIFGLSGFARQMYISKDIPTIYPKDYSLEYYQNYFCEPVNDIQNYLVIKLFQDYCNQKGWKHYTFLSFETLNKFKKIDTNTDMTDEEISAVNHKNNVLDLLDWKYIMDDMTFMDYIDGRNNDTDENNEAKLKWFFKNNQPEENPWKNNELFAPCGHPNHKGYSMWADYLYTRLQDLTLT